jgi:uncharacterized lipoprotein YbaY
VSAPSPLPADAVVRVQLRDVGRANAPATVLGQQDIAASAGPPYAFTVTAPTSVVGPGARLTVVVQVIAGDRLLFIGDAAGPLPATGASGLQVAVSPAARTPSPAAPAVSLAPLPVPAAPAVVAASPPPAAGRPYRCAAETFRIAFEDNVALLTTADGAVARLPRIDATEEAGAPRMFSNSILTVLRDGDTVRFSRGRAALITCAPQ